MPTRPWTFSSLPFLSHSCAPYSRLLLTITITILAATTTVMLLSYADATDVRHPNPHSNRNDRNNSAHVHYVRGRVRYLRVRQAALPRFMYANGEIVKRNHAVGIDVSYATLRRRRSYSSSVFTFRTSVNWCYI